MFERWLDNSLQSESRAFVFLSIEGSVAFILEKRICRATISPISNISETYIYWPFVRKF